jgi:hypothetical protein
MKTRVPMIMKRKGFKQISFNTGIYEGGLYVIISGGVGELYKILKK